MADNPKQYLREITVGYVVREWPEDDFPDGRYDWIADARESDYFFWTLEEADADAVRRLGGR